MGSGNDMRKIELLSDFEEEREDVHVYWRMLKRGRVSSWTREASGCRRAGRVSAETAYTKSLAPRWLNLAIGPQ